MLRSFLKTSSVLRPIFNQFTWLLVRFVLVMVLLVLLINGLIKGNWGEALFFAIAVAVGLTPAMLPVIITVCLPKGAIAMSRKKVIAKRINAIQNLGAMDVLCTDKTGTLTMDQVILERHCDVLLNENDGLLALAHMNSQFQTGWLAESLLTQTRIIHIIRTNKIPFVQSRASWPLGVMSAAVVAIGMGLPFSPLGRCLGFTPLPLLFLPLLVVTVLLYGLLTHSVKIWLLRKNWI